MKMIASFHMEVAHFDRLSSYVPQADRHGRNKLTILKCRLDTLVPEVINQRHNIAECMVFHGVILYFLSQRNKDNSYLSNKFGSRYKSAGIRTSKHTKNLSLT